MNYQNFQDIYNRYTNQFPELEQKIDSYNIPESKQIYTPKSSNISKNYAYTESSQDEQQEKIIEYSYEPCKNAYTDWIQENIVQQSQVNVIRMQTRTEYAKSSKSSTGKHYVCAVGKTHVTKQVSRRYLRKYYENANYNSEITSNTGSSENSTDEEDNVIENYEGLLNHNLINPKLEKKGDYSQGNPYINDSMENNVDPNETNYSAGDMKENVGKVLSETRLQRFDRLVTSELKRRRDSKHVMLDPVTSDVELTKAVNHLVHAENADTFHGAVRAAEEAAAKASPEQAEEAAVAGAREYQAEVTDLIEESVDGWIPIKVLGYVGITRPKLPTKS